MKFGMVGAINNLLEIYPEFTEKVKEKNCITKGEYINLIVPKEHVKM